MLENLVASRVKDSTIIHDSRTSRIKHLVVDYSVFIHEKLFVAVCIDGLNVNATYHNSIRW